MAAQLIPTAQNAFFTQVTDFEGTDYLLRFDYNQREACYYLSIGNPTTGLDILSGVKVVCSYGLIRRYGGIAGLPPGEIMALVAPGVSDAPADLGELGENLRVELTYFPAADLVV